MTDLIDNEVWSSSFQVINLRFLHGLFKIIITYNLDLWYSLNYHLKYSSLPSFFIHDIVSISLRDYL